jgi:hypothetical protein
MGILLFIATLHLADSGTPALTFAEGPQISNGLINGSCNGNATALIIAEAACAEDPLCFVLHDWGCQNRTWRACNGTLASIQAHPLAISDTAACTRVKSAQVSTLCANAPIRHQDALDIEICSWDGLKFSSRSAMKWLMSRLVTPATPFYLADYEVQHPIHHRRRETTRYKWTREGEPPVVLGNGKSTPPEEQMRKLQNNSVIHVQTSALQIFHDKILPQVHVRIIRLLECRILPRESRTVPPRTIFPG